MLIDNSNIFGEGRWTAQSRLPHDPNAYDRFRIDYSRFLDCIVGDRDLSSVYMVGSKIKPYDPFWTAMTRKGINAKVLDRHHGREVGVDHDLAAEMTEIGIREQGSGGVIALVAGDGGYHTVLDRVHRKGWELEVYFWSSGCSSLIRETPWYINLDNHFSEFCYFERFK